MKQIIFIMLFAIIYAGCNKDRPTRYIEVVKTVEVHKDCPVPTYQQSPEPLRPAGSMIQYQNIYVWIPTWLENTPNLKQQALEQIVNTVPEFDERIASDIKGPPPGYTIYIQDPGAFSYNSRLVVGLTDMISSISVAWRFPNTNPILMPALAHELRHAHTGDTNAGD